MGLPIRSWISVAAWQLVLILGSCNYSITKDDANAPGTPAGATDLQWLAGNLFQPHCASCHNGGRQPGGYKFETTADLMNAARTGGIRPGSADSSPVYQAIAGGSMPPGGNKPGTDKLAVLKCWIDGGALEESTACRPADAGDATGNKPPGGGPGNGAGGGAGSDDARQDDDHGGGGDDDGSGDDRGSGSGGGDDDGSGDDRGSDSGSGTGDGDDSGGGHDGGQGSSGDGDGGIDPDPSPRSFSADVAPLLATHCVACHNSGLASADVNLESFDHIMRPAAGPQLVISGAGADSLIFKVVDDGRMPMGADPLAAADKLIIRQWIDGGCHP